MKKMLFLPVIGLLFVCACKREYAINPLPADTTPPTLTTPFVSTAATTRFVPFGVGTAGGTSAGYEITLSNANTTVQAATKGYVKAVEQNAGGDYKISVLPFPNSVYTIIYNHVSNVTVAAGDSFAVGVLLGKVGVGGVTSLQVNKLIGNTTYAFCPDSLSGPGFRSAIGQAITRHNQLNPTDTIAGPCYATTLQQ